MTGAAGYDETGLEGVSRGTYRPGPVDPTMIDRSEPVAFEEALREALEEGLHARLWSEDADVDAVVRSYLKRGGGHPSYAAIDEAHVHTQAEAEGVARAALERLGWSVSQAVRARARRPPPPPGWGAHAVTTGSSDDGRGVGGAPLLTDASTCATEHEDLERC